MRFSGILAGFTNFVTFLLVCCQKDETTRCNLSYGFCISSKFWIKYKASSLTSTSPMILVPFIACEDIRHDFQDFLQGCISFQGLLMKINTSPMTLHKLLLGQIYVRSNLLVWKPAFPFSLNSIISSTSMTGKSAL